ncbi:MAG: ACT domain-containing protein [Nanoarchaeota archaeon]|nr:ACT domain-containing protein [Nanoarchaeota archaeon]
MVTISHLVEKTINERPLLFQALEQDIVSFGNLAAQLESEISEELGKDVRRSAIVMALRRYTDKIQEKSKIAKFDFRSEINMKTNLCDLAVRKSPGLFLKLQRIHKIADYGKGDTLNIIHGNYEVSIVTNIKHIAAIKKELKGEKIIKIEQNLVALSLNFSEKFLYTPGIIATVVRKLTWENINIYELISTFTELTFIISSKDATKGYNALQRLVNL